MLTPRKIRKGDLVRIVDIPPGLNDSAGIGTAQVFASALGKTFRVEDISEHGHIELVVVERQPSSDTYKSDTIWIEPEFVEKIGDS